MPLLCGETWKLLSKGKNYHARQIEIHYETRVYKAQDERTYKPNPGFYTSLLYEFALTYTRMAPICRLFWSSSESAELLCLIFVPFLSHEGNYMSGLWAYLHENFVVRFFSKFYFQDLENIKDFQHT